jgi:ClpP class serine protease
MTGDLYEMALAVPWCITDEALEAMLRIAVRDPLPEAETARRMHGPKSLALRSGKRHEDSQTMTVRDGVATIPIDGPIYRYADFFTAVSGGVTTESLARDFALALDDPSIAAILFMIDSPGGEATGINELADTIYAARGRKPIVAYGEGYVASAAYWIASAADMLIVDDTALVGSIGTVMGVPDPSKRITRSIEFVSRQSPRKRADPTSDTGRAYLQSLVDDMTEVFIAKVARNRAIDPSAVLAVEGGLLVGQQAVDAGLADVLGAEERIAQALARGALPLFGLPPLRRAITTGSALFSTHTIQEDSPMADQKGFWAGFWGGAREAGIVPEASADPTLPPTAPAQASAPRAEPSSGQDAELAKLRAENRRLRAEQIQKDAAAFVASHAQQTYPAEAQALASLYIRAAEIDQTHPRADGQPSCVALLEAATTARPAHRLDTQVLTPDTSATVLTNNAGGEDKELASVRAKTEQYAGRQSGKRR